MNKGGVLAGSSKRLGVMMILAGMVLGISSHSWAASEDIEGKWVGVMVVNGRQGDVEIVLEVRDGALTGRYSGLPSFSGPLQNIRYGEGKQPGTLTLTMTSLIYKAGTQDEAVLRFYLMHDPALTQLHGIVYLDQTSKKRIPFDFFAEKQPCCHDQCKHFGKSQCSPK